QDADAVAELHALSWRSTYRGILLDAFLEGDLRTNRILLWRRRMTDAPANQYVVVAQEGSTIVGFACVYGSHDTTWGSMLDNLHVSPLAKGHGVGTRLIARAARWSQDRHPASKFHLWVFTKNTAAIDFYKGLGGALVETVESEPPGGGLATEFRVAWSDPG